MNYSRKTIFPLLFSFFILLVPPSNYAGRQHDLNTYTQKNYSSHALKQRRQLEKAVKGKNDTFLSNSGMLGKKEMGAFLKMNQYLVAQEKTGQEKVKREWTPQIGMKNPVLIGLLFSFLLLDQVRGQWAQFSARFNTDEKIEPREFYGTGVYDLPLGALLLQERSKRLNLEAAQKKFESGLTDMQNREEQEKNLRQKFEERLKTLEQQEKKRLEKKQRAHELKLTHEKKELLKKQAAERLKWVAEKYGLSAEKVLKSKNFNELNAKETEEAAKQSSIVVPIKNGEKRLFVNQKSNALRLVRKSVNVGACQLFYYTTFLSTFASHAEGDCIAAVVKLLRDLINKKITKGQRELIEAELGRRYALLNYVEHNGKRLDQVERLKHAILKMLSDGEQFSVYGISELAKYLIAYMSLVQTLITADLEPISTFEKKREQLCKRANELCISASEFKPAQNSAKAILRILALSDLDKAKQILKTQDYFEWEKNLAWGGFAYAEGVIKTVEQLVKWHCQEAGRQDA